MIKKYVIFLGSFVIMSILGIISCEDNPVEPKPNPKQDTVLVPEIIKIEPVNAKNGEVIRLIGKNFRNDRGSSYVVFGTDKALSSDYSLWSDTLIIMMVPELAKTGYVKIVIDTLISNLVYFTVGTNVPAPLISRINPDKAYIGDDVTLEGANFLNTRDSSYILFHGSKLTETYYKSWTGSKIVIKVPNNAQPKKDMISIFVQGKQSNLVEFTVKEKIIPKDPPVIDSIKPNIAQAGDTIKVFGSFFTDFRTQYNGFISIAGVKIDDESAYADWKNKLILLIIPKNAKSGKLYVSKEDLKSNEVDFTYGKPVKDPPVIESMSLTNLLPGQTVDLNGKNFGSSQGLSSVKISGNILSRNNIASWNDVKVTLSIPGDLTPGLYKISVIVDNIESNQFSFTVKETHTNTYLIETVLISKGSFIMGTDNDDMWANPQHQVTLTKDFYMSKTEITQLLWRAASASFPDYLDADKGDKKPATQLSWMQIITWCNAASLVDKLQPCYTVNGDEVTCDFSKNGYRLPTEAEWEYACRAGTTGDVHFSGNVSDYAWMGSNSGKHINDVAQKLANPWGLFDMYGNAEEWVWDWLETWDDTPMTDPKGPESFEGNGKVVKGGSCQSTDSQLKSWFRQDFGVETRDRKIGFRVVRNK